MPKQTLKTAKFTLDDLARTEQHLQQILGGLQASRDAVAELGAEEIYVFGSKSLERGLRQLDGYAGELVAAMHALARGTPYTQKTRKGDL